MTGCKSNKVGSTPTLQPQAHTQARVRREQQRALRLAAQTICPYKLSLIATLPCALHAGSVRAQLCAPGWRCSSTGWWRSCRRTAHCCRWCCRMRCCRLARTRCSRRQCQQRLQCHIHSADVLSNNVACFGRSAESMLTAVHTSASCCASISAAQSHQSAAIKQVRREQQQGVACCPSWAWLTCHPHWLHRIMITQAFFQLTHSSRHCSR
jgi:hypothetical protein